MKLNKISSHIYKNKIYYWFTIGIIHVFTKSILKEFEFVDSLEFIKEFILGFIILDLDFALCYLCEGVIL